MATRLSRVVINHSTHVEGLSPVLKRVAHSHRGASRDVAIHTAIHTMGKNDTVSTSFGDLLIGKTAWGAGVVNLPGSTATMMGCNPTKDSKFGGGPHTGGPKDRLLGWQMW